MPSIADSLTSLENGNCIIRDNSDYLMSNINLGAKL